MESVFIQGDDMIAYDLTSLSTNKISFYLALEQVLLSHLNDDIFFLWDISTSIVAGRNQLIEAEVNQEYVRAHHIPIFRRPSGGGTIYADEGCFMYSFLTKEKNRDLIIKTYLTRLMKALQALGLEVVFSGRNDLLFQGKKFSGTAIQQTPQGSIIHGTFLYDTNLACLVEALNVDPTKIISKGIKSVQERVINLKPFLKLNKHELMNYLVKAMGDKVVFLDQNFIQEAKEIEKTYASNEWIYGKNPKYSIRFKKRFAFGGIEAYLVIKQGIILEFDLRGDFFERQPLEPFVRAFQELPYTKQAVLGVLQTHPIDRYIYDATNDDFIKLIFEEEL